jgi:uncharacterized membrane protein YphA (DoxX/SURF4 family)
MTTHITDGAGGQTKSPSRYLTTAARILMGLVFLVFGLNGFLNFIPQPPSLPDKVAAFLGALRETAYMLPLIFGTQLLVGVMLLVNLYVPIVLVVIAPVIVHIIAFHIFLNPSGIVPGLIVLALEIYLVYSYRSAYRGMLAIRATPDAQ